MTTLNKIELIKVNGKGFASKRSARNAFNSFAKLNSEVMSQQKYQLEFIENFGTFSVIATPESGLIFTDSETVNVLYRTVTDKKHDRPMTGYDSRPRKVTEEEMKLQQEIEVLETLINTLLERNGDYDTVSEFKDSCKFARDLHNEQQRLDKEIAEEEAAKSVAEIEAEAAQEKAMQTDWKADNDKKAELIAKIEKEEGRTLSVVERAFLVVK